MPEKEQYSSRIVGYEEVDPNTIVLNPRNPRVHTEQQQKAMDKILRKFGWLNNIVINKTTGHLIDGEMRVRESIKKKSATVPVTYVELTEEEELQVIATFDPIGYLATESSEMYKKIFQEADMSDDSLTEVVNDIVKRNRISFYDDEQEEDGDTDEEEETIEDKNKQLVDKWEVEFGQVWKIGQHKLMCGSANDVDDVATLMDNRKASCGFFDPPYGINYQSHKRVKTGRFDELDNDDSINADFLFSIIPYMEEKSAIYVCTNWQVFNQWRTLIEGVIPIKNVVVWDKPGGGIGDLKGNYWNQHEFIMFFAMDGHKLRGTREGNVWNFGGKNVNAYVHPTQKPIGLPSKCFEHSSDIGDVVVDLFCGSGTSIISANNVQRVCYAMDISPKWVAVSLERMNELGLIPERIL